MARDPRGGEAAAQRAYLRDLPVGDAAKVMGSCARLQRVLDGADPVVVVNRGVPEGYRTVRLGGVAQSRRMTQDAYAVAKAGGLHSGLLRRFYGESAYAIRKSIESLREQADIHRRYIADPSLKVDAGIGELATQRLVHKKWPKEVERFEQEIEVLQGILRERT